MMMHGFLMIFDQLLFHLRFNKSSLNHHGQTGFGEEKKENAHDKPSVQAIHSLHEVP